jgi:Leucine-rich repeat (LRR) protein
MYMHSVAAHGTASCSVNTVYPAANADPASEEGEEDNAAVQQAEQSMPVEGASFKPATVASAGFSLPCGHDRLAALFLRYCGNKSVAVDYEYQEYLKAHGLHHLQKATRALRPLCTAVRKIDETACLGGGPLPSSLGYISGLQEMYARRVGITGSLPTSLGRLTHLRVLSMGNNEITGRIPSSLGRLPFLQRVVLHQNELSGVVPASLAAMGCIVNVAGNVQLDMGPDVPQDERDALGDFFYATNGHRWTNNTGWDDPSQPVSSWYKVGVLASHVHSLVMSSNRLEGILPESIGRLQHLRMIELATMPRLRGPLPSALCGVTTLRRLCICRCGLTGPINPQIGDLQLLEELQLFGNHFTGAIPAELGRLANLKLLSLGEYTGGNDFDAAPIPSFIMDLESLEALFLANCNLVGPVPLWVTTLTGLRQLDLQHNRLSGDFPPAIGRLKALLYLNLKDNPGVGGSLPVRELALLQRLNRLSIVNTGLVVTPEMTREMAQVLPRCKIWM